MRTFINSSLLLSLASLVFAAGCGVSADQAENQAPESVADSVEALEFNVLSRVKLEALDLKVNVPPQMTVQGALGRVTTAKMQTQTQNGGLRFVLRGGDGKLQEVELSPTLVKSAGGLLRLTGSKVSLKGYVSPASGKFVATALNVTSVPPAQSLVGTKRWLTVLCSFSDLPLPATEPAEYFQSLYGSSYPGLGDYWSKASNGQMTVDASSVVDWQPLPFPASHYQAQAPDARIANLANDCLVNSLIAGFDFTTFDGVALAFSHNLDQQLIAGPVSLDGVKNYAFSMLSPATFRDQAVMARVMGMGMDLTVSGMAPLKFDSEWDVMSGGGVCRTLDPVHGCVAVLPAAEHAAKSGWLSSSQIRSAGSGLSSVALDFVGSPVQTNHSGIVRIPIDAHHYYTIEARNEQSAGLYDREVPRGGVIIHKMDTTPLPDDSPTESQLLAATTRLRFVDNNGNNDPNDPGSEFGPGSTFSDPAAQLLVTVSAKRAYGYDVTILRSPTLSVSNNAEANVKVGSSINCGAGASQCSAGFAPNSEVVLTANAIEGKRIKSWSGCTQSTNRSKCTVTMTGSRSVSVTTERDPGYRPPCECLPSWPVYKCEQICGDFSGPDRPGDDRPPRQIP